MTITDIEILIGGIFFILIIFFYMFFKTNMKMIELANKKNEQKIDDMIKEIKEDNDLVLSIVKEQIHYIPSITLNSLNEALNNNKNFIQLVNAFKELIILTNKLKKITQEIEENTTNLNKDLQITVQKLLDKIVEKQKYIERLQKKLYKQKQQEQKG